MVPPIPRTPTDTEEQRRALSHSNRRVLAERQSWPDGVLEACERIEDAYPDWSVGWLGENPGPPAFARPSTFRAQPRPDRRHHSHTDLRATTADELEALLAACEDRVTVSRPYRAHPSRNVW
ncbi:hypothetical protein ACTI_15330 [Actinoplanes sp. OR16]|nr:hypothetical protein ACTI_15330 [Actinoplanes sp. OR16]